MTHKLYSHFLSLDPHCHCFVRILWKGKWPQPHIYIWDAGSAWLHQAARQHHYFYVDGDGRKASWWGSIHCPEPYKTVTMCSLLAVCPNQSQISCNNLALKLTRSNCFQANLHTTDPQNYKTQGGGECICAADDLM